MKKKTWIPVIALVALAGILVTVAFWPRKTQMKTRLGDATAPSGPVSCKATAESPPKDYENLLKSLSKTDPESILLAVAEYERLCLAKKGAAFNDEAFLFFRTFYQDSLDTIGTQIQGALNRGDESAENDFPWLKDLGRYGFDIRMSEGDNYLVEGANFLRDRFARWLSPQLEEFVTQNALENKEGFSDDASLLIGFDRVADRALKWESLLKKYPKSPVEEETEAKLELYLSTLLSGMDNTPVFDDSGELKAEVKDLYERIMKTDPGTRVAKVIGEYYSLLKRAGFKSTGVKEEELKEIFEKNGLRSLIGVQPPAQ